MFYPAFLNLQGKRCLVVGAGAVAERKVISLLHSGGDVHLISPSITRHLHDLIERNQVSWRDRQFQDGDTSGFFLVCAATDLPQTNTRIFKEAHEENGIDLVNIVDVAPECTFASTSIVVLDKVSISISTSGKSPAMCKRMREYIESKFCRDAINHLEDESHWSASNNIQKTPVMEEHDFESKVPYPVGFLIEGRQCMTVGKSHELSERVNLLHRCGAKVKMTNDALMQNSSAFLIFTDAECREYDGSQLVELTTNPMCGTFYTPLTVIDRDLVIGITPNLDSKSEWQQAKRIQADLATQFESRGYGHFLDLLGSFRSKVMNLIPTQTQRKQFFEEIIDQNFKGEKGSCCFDFDNLGCSAECTFNLVRTRRTDQVQQTIKKKLQTYSYSY
ncbi:TPA: hypothetical protein EYN98_01015 [Candidatus Poribacteria bacterium]|nr:hypothetical protein [Candidatus Poribacteria bacterium]